MVVVTTNDATHSWETRSSLLRSPAGFARAAAVAMPRLSAVQPGTGAASLAQKAVGRAEAATPAVVAQPAPAASASSLRASTLAAAAERARALADEVPAPPAHPFASEPRVYRHPDGSLRSVPPPRDPFTVAARRDWADLVTYARTTGGCAQCSSPTGACYRHGQGVSYAAHAAYLAKLGLEPERGADGSWVGFDPTKTDPIAHDTHPFNAAYAEEA